jgi:hypothetical protein
MLRLPSVQFEYTLVFSGDPALNLPEVPDLAEEEADPAVLAKHKELATERGRLLRVARETGNWGALLHAGAEPTMFQMRPIHGMALVYLSGEATRGQFVKAETVALAFRLALMRIDNLGGLQVKRDAKAANGLGLVTAATMEKIYDIGLDLGTPQLGRSVVAELGEIVLERALEGVSPKS